MRTHIGPFWCLGLITLSLTVGCGDDSSPADASVSTQDAATPDVRTNQDAGDGATDAASSDAAVDSGTSDSGTSDSGTSDSTCTQGPAGPHGLPAACTERDECFNDIGCVTALLVVNDYEGYSPCSETLTFGPSDSAATCELPPSDLIEDAPEARCGEEEYSGEVTFYCAEGSDIVLLVHSMDAPNIFLGYYLSLDAGFSSTAWYETGLGIREDTSPGRVRTLDFSAIDTSPGGIGPSFSAIAHFTSGLVPGPEYITGGFQVEFGVEE